MNPRSSTETFASSIGRILPFRKTMCASLLEPQPECIPGPPENPGDSHRLESDDGVFADRDRKSTRLNSSHSQISYAVFCLKKKKHICNIFLNIFDPFIIVESKISLIARRFLSWAAARFLHQFYVQIYVDGQIRSFVYVHPR